MGVWEYRVAALSSSERTDAGSAVRLLTEQVGRARRLVAHRPLNPKEVAAWNTATIACLVKVYGRDSPNAFSVDAYPGEDAAWVDNRGKIFGGSREVAESYLASTIAARIRLLEECVISLRFAQNRTAPISPSVDPHRGRTRANHEPGAERAGLLSETCTLRS
jgi:hypothetical protein